MPLIIKHQADGLRLPVQQGKPLDAAWKARGREVVVGAVPRRVARHEPERPALASRTPVGEDRRLVNRHLQA